MNIKVKNKSINNNMKKEELIGKKVRGFRFENGKYCNLDYAINMDDYIGKEGVIIEYDSGFNSYGVRFEDGMSYHYPAERIEHHLVDEEPTIEIKEGDYIRGFEITHKGFEFTNKYIGLIGKVTNIGRHSIRVKFTDNEGVWYPKDQAIEHLCNDDMKEFEKSLDQNEEPDEETKAKVERAMKALERGIANSKWNESCIDYGKIEHDPLDDLPIIGDGVLMEVGDDEQVWYKRIVFAKYGKYFLAHDGVENIKKITYNICPNLWKYCRPITPKTKISRKEFESKFEIID
jgi:hypothetical protein